MLVNKPISKIEYIMKAPKNIQGILDRILGDYSEDEEYYLEDFNATLKTVDIDAYLDNMSIC